MAQSTALQIAADAYALVNMDQTLSSFSNSQEFPYNIALILFNDLISELNRKGNYWFCETSVSLAYSPGVYTYDLTTLATPPIEPKRITRIRRELLNYEGELVEYNWRNFQRRYRLTTIPIQMPNGWAKYDQQIQLNYIPDQDYTQKLYYYQDIPAVVNTGDILPVPQMHEDVLRYGIANKLRKRMEIPDPALDADFQMKLADLIGAIGEDAGMGTQMPAAF